MKIILINDRDTDFIEQLMNVWERSVKATHLFLTKEAIEEIETSEVAEEIGISQAQVSRLEKSAINTIKNGK